MDDLNFEDGTPVVPDGLRAAFSALTPMEQVTELSNRVGSHYDASTPERDYRFLRQVEGLLDILAERLGPESPDASVPDARAGEDDDVRREAVAAIVAERRRQVAEEGWTPGHDDREHADGGLARAAACYESRREELWPWQGTPGFKDRDRDLERAGALIVAQMEVRIRERRRSEGSADVGKPS